MNCQLTQEANFCLIFNNKEVTITKRNLNSNDVCIICIHVTIEYPRTP